MKTHLQAERERKEEEKEETKKLAILASRNLVLFSFVCSKAVFAFAFALAQVKSEANGANSW